ncbi:protein mitoshell isoform X2 [Drosophila rhopaloa]|uniref:Protein mitoshell isoform X2 n=1 Tax=Drosophila rhopaloa TaxID=1041015 RepID=A0A6P4FVS3_DRORH|nr:protein mitoshell isoform X2 [Drosophila rhopaloa]
MNIPIYQLPSVTMQSMRQQSMYQQTYLDRNRMVTDVFVQEHVSQSSWSMATPSLSAVFIPGTANCPIMTGSAHGACHPNPPAPHPPPPAANPPHMTYMAMPASMNAYGQGQVYSARASATTSCNMAGFYVPNYYSSGTHAPPAKQFRTAHTQTQAPIKRCCDVATQVDMGLELSRLEVMKPKPAPFFDSFGPEESSISSLESGAGDGLRVQNLLRNSEVVLLQQRLHDITRISLQGSEIAERLANAHRNRPCFKKIDTLCARLKQDLLRPDGVLPNINSQGIAWAVKDFIFVFTRIVNAWVILKGYVYNTPEGLNKIKDELPAGFMAIFDSWQVSTLSLVQMIIKSFVSLDELLQKQKNSFSGKDGSALMHVNNSSSLRSLIDSNDSSSLGQKNQAVTNGHPICPGQGPSAYSTPRNQNGMGKSFSEGQESRGCRTSTSPAIYKPKCGINLNYLYTMIEDSEETQRNVDANGTYLKTGTYQPLQKESKQLEMPPLKPKDPYQESQWQRKIPQKPLPPQEIRQPPAPIAEKSRAEPERQKDVRAFTNPFSLIGREVTRQLCEFSDRVMELKHLERFFRKQFTRNYYPDFFQHCQDEFIDVRAIILQCERASYHHLYQAIHDLRRITFAGRCYLKIYSDENLQHYIDLYERSVNEMLSKPPHIPNQYDHIMGRPGEKLFNYEI